MRLSVRALGLLALLTILIYGRALPSAFVFDDHWTILQNPSLRAPFDFLHFFADPNTAANPSMEMGKDIYRPLSALTFWIDHHLWGTNPTPYRVVNVLLHLLNAFLVFLLLARRFRFGALAAWLGAAFFLAHPAQVESVIWITQRSNLLCMMGILAGLLFLSGDEKLPLWKTAAGFLCVAAALFSKETAVVFPVLLILTDAAAQPDVSFRDLLAARARLYAFLFVLALVYIGIRHAAVGSLAQRGWRTGSVAGNVLFGARAWMNYIATIFLPFHLTVSHAEPGGAPWKSVAAWTGVVSWVALAASAVILWRRGKRAPAAGLAWLFIALSPVLGFVPLVTFMAERFLYAPLFGAALIFSWALDRSGKRTASAAGLVIVMGLTLVSFPRAQEWRDDLTLWQAATRVEPKNSFAWACRGEAELQENDLKSARHSYETAVEQQPSVAVAFTAANNLAQISNLEGRPDEALRWSDRALAIHPDAAEPLYNRAVALTLSDKPDEALAVLDRAAKIHPGDPSLPQLREKIQQKESSAK